MLLTDGQENASSNTFEQLKGAFNETGISIFPVAYGSADDQKQCQCQPEFECMRKAGS